MKRVALEGPSLSGKSTLARGLAARLEEQGRATVTLPDYFEIRSEMRIDFPLSPKTPQEQLLLITMHIGLEMLRHTTVPCDTDVVILDRSLWTALAHTHALVYSGTLNPFDSFRDPRLIEAMKPWLPDLVLYVETPLETRHRRRGSRDSLPALHLDADFNDGLQDFFRNQIPECSSEIKFIDGSVDTMHTLEQAWSIMRDTSIC